MPPPVGKGAISVASVRPSVAYIANSRTQRPRVAKFGRKVPHLRCHFHTSFKVKRSKPQRSWLEAGGGMPCWPNPAGTLLVRFAGADGLFHMKPKHLCLSVSHWFVTQQQKAAENSNFVEISLTTCVTCETILGHSSKAKVKAHLPPKANAGSSSGGPGGSQPVHENRIPSM